MTGPDHDRDTNRDTTIAGEGDYTVTIPVRANEEAWEALAAELNEHRRNLKEGT